MRSLCIVVLATFALSSLFGCKAKPKAPKEVPKAARGEASNLAGEADFAIQVRDYPRAEKALTRAVELDPEISAYWTNLGVVRRKQGNSAGTRAAYEKALSLAQAEADRNPTSAAAALEPIHIFVLLGQEKEARQALEKARRAHPNDRDIRVFTEQKIIDQMVTSPELKALRP